MNTRGASGGEMGDARWDKSALADSVDSQGTVQKENTEETASRPGSVEGSGE